MQGGFGGGNSQLPKTDGGSETKKQRSKRTQRTGEKAAPRSKKRKKDEEEKQAVYSSSDSFTHLKQVSCQNSPLPLPPGERARVALSILGNGSFYLLTVSF